MHQLKRYHFAPFFACGLIVTAAAQAQGGPATSAPAPGSQMPAVQTAAPAQAAQEVSSLDDEMIGGVDWESGFVFEVGDGAPPNNAINPAQARMRAKRAAIDDAMARLLETVQGVRVDSESTTRDFINEHRAVNTAVSGLVRNAEIVELRQHDDGSYQIKMRMPLCDARGLSSALLPAVLSTVRKSAVVTRTVRSDAASPGHQVSAPSQGAKVSTAPAAQAPYSALIVDATGVPASQAMFPRLLDRSGSVLYDVSLVDPNVAVSQGICAYRKSMDKAKADQRAGSNPLVVKAVDATGSGRVDLVLEDSDAARVAAAASPGGLFRDAKVIVVTQ